VVANAWSTAAEAQCVAWIIAGFAIVGFMGFGLLILILALANMNTNSKNPRGNFNSRLPIATGILQTRMWTPARLQIQRRLSTETWGTGAYSMATLWYTMMSITCTPTRAGYIVMYGPNKNTKTENATVRVTARNVDSVCRLRDLVWWSHGKKSKATTILEDYAFLIRTGDNPGYQVFQHKGGSQIRCVSWTQSRPSYGAAPLPTRFEFAS